MLNTAHLRFPFNPPLTKEAYLYRAIFHQHFPSESAAKTVPGGPSIACSTAAAVEWEQAWKNQLDPSGRSVSSVHIAPKDVKQ
jgi:asparagine synthase (glutamine-hydrolysing)